MMTQKTLSLTKEAYERLAGLKKAKESFSQLIIRLAGDSKPAGILEFAGIWSDDAEWDDIERSVYQRRLQPLERTTKFD
jgi:predicted CopG family antitoxin